MALSAAFSSLGLPANDLGVEEPPKGMPVTPASSVALRLAGIVGALPPKIAVDIAEEPSVEDYGYLAAVDMWGLHVNFHVPDAYYDDTLDAATSNEAYGRLSATGDSVVVGYTGMNPTGPVHVGHTHNSVIGDAVTDLPGFAGSDIDRRYHVSGAGRQMAAFTWAYRTFDGDDLESESARERVECDLVRYYCKDNASLGEADPEEVERAEAEITEVLQGIEEGDEKTYARVETAVDQVFGGIRECLEHLPAEFDEFVREARFMFSGSTRGLAGRPKETNHAVYKEDVWQLEPGDYGFEKDLVFLRSDDTSLYTTCDLVHHKWKLDDYDRTVTALDENHKFQSGQLHAVLDILGNGADKLENTIYSQINLSGGETTSTRKGTGVILDDLLDGIIGRARDEVGTRLEGCTHDDGLDEADIGRIARQAGIDAVRYGIVSKRPTRTITFKRDQVLSFETQPAPHTQHVHARCCGIADKATTAGFDASEVDPAMLTTDAEYDLLATIAQFPAVVETAADDLGPRAVVTFARELTEVFNTFYRECPVLGADEEVGATQFALVEASRNAVANVLAIVGVETPESMRPRANWASW